MSRRKSILINPQDRIELKTIAADVFAVKLEEHPLVKLMKYWLRIFQNEIVELKDRISKLETELELLKRTHAPLANNSEKQVSDAKENLSDNTKSVLTPEAIKELRLAVGCNVHQMAKIMGIPVKLYMSIEHGNVVPRNDFEVRFLQFRDMKASERRTIMQDHGIFYCKKIHHVQRRIPQPPTEQDIRITRAELHEICETLHISHPQLAKMVGVTPPQVASWFYSRTQPDEETFQKLQPLLEQARTASLAPVSKPQSKKKKKVVSPQEIENIMSTLGWSVAQLAAYLRVPEYKLRNWKAGNYSPKTLQNNKLLDLLDKIREQAMADLPVSIDEYALLKAKLKFSDFHMSEILKVPYTRTRSWTLKAEIPNQLESKKIRKLQDQVLQKTFVDEIDLPRISADRISEICKRQHITKKELAKIMRVRNNTLERWLRGGHGPSPEENEKLWILWEKPTPEPPPILSGDEIRKCRDMLKISQREMGEKLKISPKLISRLELGMQSATLEISNKIRELCNLPIPGMEEVDNER